MCQGEEVRHGMVDVLKDSCGKPGSTRSPLTVTENADEQTADACSGQMTPRVGKPKLEELLPTES